MYTVKDLTNGFFKRVLETYENSEKPVVLQILEARVMPKTDQCNAPRYRFRISDGIFYFSTCLNQVQISKRIEDDKLYEGTPIIRLNEYKFGTQHASGLRPLAIVDYTLLSKNCAILGNPVPHTGDPKDYRGLKPTLPTQTNGLSHEEDRPPNIRENPANRNRNLLLGSQNLTPIRLITPYVNKWRICGVVTGKEDLREIRTAQRGEMKVFNFDITDEQGACIRIAAFNEAAEKFYAIVQKGMMYYVSGASVKQANKRYNTTGHDYELSLRPDAEVVPCTDREKIVQPKLSLNVVPLSNVATHVNECIDVIAVVERIHEIQQVTQRATGEPLEKREVELIDQSETVVFLTVWGEQARNFDCDSERQTIGIKGAVVREYNGSFTLSALKSTRIELNMECEETNKLYAWYKEKRPYLQVNTISRSLGNDAYTRDLRIVEFANLNALGKDEEKGAYFNITGLITSIKSDGALYKSCGTNGCKKKVVDIDNQYRCEKCNLTLSSFKYVLLMSVEISDFSGSHWVTVFEEQASKLLQKSAEELGHLLDTNRPEEYNDAFSSVRFRPYTFRLRAKNEFYNDMERIKWTALSIDHVNYDKYIQELKKAVEILDAL